MRLAPPLRLLYTGIPLLSMGFMEYLQKTVFRLPAIVAMLLSQIRIIAAKRLTSPAQVWYNVSEPVKDHRKKKRLKGTNIHESQ